MSGGDAARHAGNGPQPRAVDAVARRRAGAAVILIVGPAAALFGALALEMGAIEAAAVLVLISGWLGPKLLRNELI